MKIWKTVGVATSEWNILAEVVSLSNSLVYCYLLNQIRYKVYQMQSQYNCEIYVLKNWNIYFHNSGYNRYT